MFERELVIWIDNENLVRIFAVQGKSNGVYLANAVPTMTVLDRASNVAVAGATWPISMTYITASTGNYEGILPDTLVIKDHQRLILRIEANAAGLKLLVNQKCIGGCR